MRCCGGLPKATSSSLIYPPYSSRNNETFFQSGVTPFSLPHGMPLYVDDRMIGLDWIILGGGGRSLKIKTSPEALIKLGAEVVPGLAG